MKAGPAHCPSVRLVWVVLALASPWTCAGKPAVDSAASPPANASATSRPPLDDIVREKSYVLRLHRLANWVSTQTESELTKAVQEAPPAIEGELMWLAYRRLQELHATPATGPLATTNTPPDMVAMDTEADQPSRKILALAKTDPVEALRQTTLLRMAPEDALTLRINIFEQLAETDVPKAFELSKGRKDMDEERTVNAIVAVWTEKDPLNALKWVKARPEGSQKYYLAYQFVLTGIFSKFGFLQALEAGKSIPATPSNLYQTWIEENVVHWIHHHPTFAINWLQQRSPLECQPDGKVIECLTPKRPELALTLLQTHGSRKLQEECLRNVVTSYMNLSSVGCLGSIRSLPHGRMYFEAANTAVGILARKDPAAAIEFYNSMPADSNRGPVMNRIVSAMPDMGAAFAWLSIVPDSPAAEKAMESLVYKYQVYDAEKMAALGSYFQNPRKQADAYGIAARIWFNKSPDDALTWFKTLDSPGQIEGILKYMAEPWVARDPGGALAYATQLGRGAAYETLVQKLAVLWAGKHPVEALNWLATQRTDSEALGAMTEASFNQLIRAQSAEARRRLDAMPPGALQKAALTGMINALDYTRATTPPAEFARWMAKSSIRPEDQASLSRQLAAVWLMRDVEGACNWIATLPGGNVRDESIHGVLDEVAKNDPSLALRLSASLSELADQLACQEKIIVMWYGRNPTKALAALAGANLPEETRTRIRDRLTATKQ